MCIAIQIGQSSSGSPFGARCSAGTDEIFALGNKSVVERRSKSRRWKDVLRVDVAKGKDELDRQSKQPQSHPCASFRPPPLHLRSLDGADRGTPPHLHSSNVLECEAIVRNKALQMKRLPRSLLNRGGTVTHLEPLHSGVSKPRYRGGLFTTNRAGWLDRSFPPMSELPSMLCARASLEP